MRSDTASALGPVEAFCPNCSNTTAEVVATVNSGGLERHFLRCLICHQTHMDRWTTLDQMVAAAEAASTV